MKLAGCCAAAFVCLATHAPAEAQQSAPGAVDASVYRVRVVLVGDANVAELRALIVEWLEPAGFSVELEAARALSVDEVLAADRIEHRARVWVTLAPRGGRLYFADRDAAHFLVRDVPLDAGLNEVGREQVAQVLLSAAIAFVEKREETPASAVRSALADANPSESERPTAERRKAEEPVSRKAPATTVLRGAVEGRYAGRYAGPAGWSHGPALGFAVGLVWPRSSLSLTAIGHGELPHRARGESVDLDISALCARGGLKAAYSFAAGHETALELVLGPCWVRAEPVTSDPTVRLRDAKDERWSLGIAVPYAVPIGPVSLILGLSLDADLTQAHYALRIGGAVKRELSPWQVRPGAFVGVSRP